MGRGSIFFLISLFLIAEEAGYAATPNRGGANISCVKESGFIEGPMVPSATAAREIYNAVAKAGHYKKKLGHTITTSDEGDRWAVSAYRMPRDSDSYVKNGMEYIFVEHGGGGFTLYIDKCTGKLSAYFAR